MKHTIHKWGVNILSIRGKKTKYHFIAKLQDVHYFINSIGLSET